MSFLMAPVLVCSSSKRLSLLNRDFFAQRFYFYLEVSDKVCFNINFVSDFSQILYDTVALMEVCCNEICNLKKKLINKINQISLCLAGAVWGELHAGEESDEHGSCGRITARHHVRDAGSRQDGCRFRQIQQQNVLPNPHRWYEPPRQRLPVFVCVCMCAEALFGSGWSHSLIYLELSK